MTFVLLLLLALLGAHGFLVRGDCQSDYDCDQKGLQFSDQSFKQCACPIGMMYHFFANNLSACGCHREACKIDVECGEPFMACQDGGCFCDSRKGLIPVKKTCVMNVSSSSTSPSTSITEPSTSTLNPMASDQKDHFNDLGFEVGDTCSSVSDCHFTDAICQDKKKCVCQVGYQLDKQDNKCVQTYCTKDEDCAKVTFGISPEGIICATGNHTCMCDTEKWHLDEVEAQCVNEKKPTWFWYALAIFIAIILVAIIVTVLACKGMCLCFGCAGGGGSSSSENSGTKSCLNSSSKP